MKLEPFTKPGSTPSRRRFWHTARLAVLSARKLQGHNITVDEHEGAGTIINAKWERRPTAAPPPACPHMKVTAVWHSFTDCGVCDGSQRLDFDIQLCFETDLCSLSDGYDYTGGGTQCNIIPTTCLPHVSINYLFYPDDNTYDISLTMSVIGCGGCCDLTHTFTRTAQPFPFGSFDSMSDHVIQDITCDRESNFFVTVDNTDTTPCPPR